MKKPKGFIERISILMVVLGLLTLAAEAGAFFYRPAEPAVSIFSEYPAYSDGAPPHARIWTVVPESTPEGAVTLRFFLDAAAGADAVCEVGLPPYGTAGPIRWRGIGQGAEKKSETGLLLVPGFPAPCDLLPVGEKDEGRVYHEKREAGGRVFIRKYRVSSEAFSAAEARAKGWIRAEAQGISGLIMVTVTDERGQRAARQLWPAGGSWWVYEETPLRRSWLVD